MVTPRALSSRFPLRREYRRPRLVPRLIYNTLDKQNATKQSVLDALENGIRGFNVGEEESHEQDHRLDLVNEAIKEGMASMKLRRQDIYIQIDLSAFLPKRIAESDADEPELITKGTVTEAVEKARYYMQHRDRGDIYDWHVSHIDCLLLPRRLVDHPRLPRLWRELEAFLPKHVSALGIVKPSAQGLVDFFSSSRVKPAVVQNDFLFNNEYDRWQRSFCRETDIMYQGMDITQATDLIREDLVVDSHAVRLWARVLKKSRVAAYYSLVLGLGHTGIHLTPGHATREAEIEQMKEAVDAVQNLETWATEHPKRWDWLSHEFKAFVGDTRLDLEAETKRQQRLSAIAPEGGWSMVGSSRLLSSRLEGGSKRSDRLVKEAEDEE